jgi:hypothetical protein
MEQEYVTSDLSIRALAARHGLNFSTLAAKARAEDWAVKRASFKGSLAARTSRPSRSARSSPSPR